LLSPDSRERRDVVKKTLIRLQDSMNEQPPVLLNNDNVHTLHPIHHNLSENWAAVFPTIRALQLLTAATFTRLEIKFLAEPVDEVHGLSTFTRWRSGIL
jgi:hypothetical protein